MKRWHLWLLLVVVTLATLGAAIAFSQWGDRISTAAVEETIRAFGPWGVLASIALMVVHSFVPFPAELIAFANGMIYGALWGTVITWVGAMLGASIAFWLARYLGRPFVERMVSRNDWRMLDDWAASNGWQVVLISRFIPVIAFNLINYAAGLTGLSWWHFLWTTAVGILPLTTLMVVMGDNVESLGWESWLALLVGGVALWFVLRQKLRVQPPTASSRSETER
jgi:uncharacterized membrane protein YdjX (TVP38/TMEM64 family)